MTSPADLPAGAELDRLIHERVMGKYIISDSYWQGYYDDAGHGHYSTNIAHAWEVVERMRELGWTPTMSGMTGGGEWLVSFTAPASGQDVNVFAPTAPLAICRAALMGAQ